MSRLEVLGKRVHQTCAPLFPEAQYLGYRLRHEPWVRQGRKFHQPHAVRIAFQQLRHDLNCQARLAAAARAGQRDKSRRTEKLLDLRYFLLAADEASHLLRQVVRRRVKRAQRGERLRQIGVQQLPDVFGSGNVAQPDAAKVQETDAVGHPLSRPLDHGLRQQDLATVRGGKTEVLEGDWHPKRIVVLEFKSAQRAKEWLNCEEYREPRKMRHRTAKTNMILVEGM